jgi:hypothetical protein
MVPSPTFAQVTATDNPPQSWQRDDEILATPPFTVNAYTSRAIREAVADGVDASIAVGKTNGTGVGDLITGIAARLAHLPLSPCHPLNWYSPRRDTPIAGDRIRPESGRDHALKETATQSGSDAAVKERNILFDHFTSMI